LLICHENRAAFGRPWRVHPGPARDGLQRMWEAAVLAGEEPERGEVDGGRGGGTVLRERGGGVRAADSGEEFVRKSEGDLAVTEKEREMKEDWDRLLLQISRAKKRGQGTRLTPHQVDMLALNLSNGISELEFPSEE